MKSLGLGDIFEASKNNEDALDELIFETDDHSKAFRELASTHMAHGLQSRKEQINIRKQNIANERKMRHAMKFFSKGRKPSPAAGTAM
jgi:hypothetical protein